MRILIVEDEKDLSMILTEMLEMEGYYVDAAYDGVNGLDNALSGIYDIIILDIMLPEMDGIQALSEIRKNNINTPVLILTVVSPALTGLLVLTSSNPAIALANTSLALSTCS